MPSAEFEPAPKNSRVSVIERVESPLQVPETPEVALEKMRREEDNHSEVGASVVNGNSSPNLDKDGPGGVIFWNLRQRRSSTNGRAGLESNTDASSSCG
jgi:hypothetical protein